MRRPYGARTGRLQLRYALQSEEHLDEIVVAEDDKRVVVFGTVCTPIGLLPGHLDEGPYHVYLKGPLAGREVFDATADAPVPYFNVYDGIFERVEAMREARRPATRAPSQRKRMKSPASRTGRGTRRGTRPRPRRPR